MIETGDYNTCDINAIPLYLEGELEPQRPQLQEILSSAQRRLKQFALKNGWEQHIAAPFAGSAHIFAHKANFDRFLLLTCGLDPAQELPKTYCAALEQNILMAVSPVLYREVYPQGDEEAAFEKLLAHEMAHRLHIRILDGDEEAMGPVWFYEGFALYAASQLEGAAPQMSMGEIWSVVQDDERADYRRYVTVFRYFLERVDIHYLVEWAGKPDFEDRLRKICNGAF